MIDFTVVIVTHNREASLRRTLAALGAMRPAVSWELVVVDNASTDATRAAVAAAAAGFPVAVTYQYEPVPGKYSALNHGIRAVQGRFIAATDDDAFPGEDWLDRAAEGFERFRCDFVGGPVSPIWGGGRPPWLEEKSALAGKVLALQDYGSHPREYGTDIGWPLGVNVAYRRDVFERVGFFDGGLGRIAGTLRSQAQREWHLRARAAGLHGFYLPEMLVRHAVPRERLTKAYFRQWFFWHGVSRAILHAHTGLDILEPDELLARSAGRQIAGVPRAVWRRLALSGASWVRRRAYGDATAAFEYELWLAFCAGIVRERWRDRRPSSANAPAHRAVPCLRATSTKSAPTPR